MPMIDPAVEELTRAILGHVIRGETDAFDSKAGSLPIERYQQVLGLCLLASAYVAVDASGHWPIEADVRRISRIVAERGKDSEMPVGEAEAYDYLSGVALGFKPALEVLSDAADQLLLPIFITAGMVVAFKPAGRDWQEYLDQIWNAYNTAEDLGLSVFPALQVVCRMMDADRSRDEKAG
jgi:hypothetical protein